MPWMTGLFFRCSGREVIVVVFRVEFHVRVLSHLGRSEADLDVCKTRGERRGDLR